MKKNIIYKSFSSQRKKPKNIEPHDEELFAHEYYKEFEEIYYIEYKDVTIVNQSVYSLKRLKFFTEYTYFYKPKYLRLLKDIFKNLIYSNSSKDLLDEGIWITDNKSSVYFHWLCDALPRYSSLPKEYKHLPVLIPKVYDIDWIKEFLVHLGINFIIFDSNKKIRVKKIIIPSYTAPSGNFHNTSIHELRNSLFEMSSTKTKTQDNYERVWICMSKHRRPVRNIDEIRPILKKYNFKEVIFESLSLVEKLNLMKNVNILAGAHSSGLTNMLFMEKGSKVVDIRDPKDNIKNAFFSLASELDLDYYYMEREDNNYTVIDPKKLEYLLSSIT